MKRIDLDLCVKIRLKLRPPPQLREASSSSVEVPVTVKRFQLCAELVQVHVPQPSFPVLVEVCSNLVKSLAPGLWNPEECEDEEEEKQRREDEEHVGPAKVLRTEADGSVVIRGES